MDLYPKLDDLLELRHQAHTMGLASHHLVNSSFSGLYSSIFRGTGLDFDEVREYQPGDDVRNMEWKVTARTNIPHMKIFREERERSVVLCVDQGTYMGFGTRGTFKSVQAARAAALLGWAANSVKDRVGGLVYGNHDTGMLHFRPTKDRRALWRLLKSLSRPVANINVPKDSLLMALEHAQRGADTGGLIFVIGDFNRETDSLETALGRLCQHHSVVLVPIDDPGDYEMPDMGVILFASRDGAMIEIDTSDEKGRFMYKQEWKNHRIELLGLTQRLGIPCIPIRTDQEIHAVMSQGLQHNLGSKSRARST